MHLSFLQDPFYQSDRKDPFYQSTLASPLISFDMSLIFRRKKTLSIKPLSDQDPFVIESLTFIQWRLV